MVSRLLVVTRSLCLVLAAIAVVAGCEGAKKRNEPAAVPEVRPGFLAGYLPPKDLPNARTLLPAPPAAGSAALALDEEATRNALVLRDTPRWALAAEDANLMFPRAAGTFSCALGTAITEQDSPHLYVLLRRSLTDAGLATYSAKSHYSRARPFVVNRQPTCAPDDEARLIQDGAYPSGHSAIGWAWALILSEVAPERTDAIVARGQAFGDSRLICNVHWQSDVVQGRLVGAAVVARLHGDAAFRADLEAAKAEFAAARTAKLPPARDCTIEAAALAQPSSSKP